MKIPLDMVTNLWLKLNGKPKMLWFNFDTYVLYFSDKDEDPNSNAHVGTYTNNVLLFEFQEDIKETVKEESYHGVHHTLFSNE